MTDIGCFEVRDVSTGAVATACVRRSDGALIPADPANIDWCAYEAWLAADNIPAAAPPPQSAPAAGSP